MQFTFRDIVEQFLTRRSAYEYETEEFVSLQHDRDLVTGIDQQLDRIASAYGYFTALSFETQGINDNGSDVSVRYRDLGTDGEAPTRVLGFQIKSHSELTNADTVAKIKAQRDDAFRKIPDLEHYYILLCGYEKKLKKRFNAIRAEFLKAERTTVVSPTNVLPFLRYESFQIDAQVKRVMDETDVVLKAMRQSLDMSTDTAKALACYLCAHLLATGSPTTPIVDLREGFVGNLYDRVIAAARDRKERLETAREIYDLGDEIDEFEEEEGSLSISSLDSDTALASDIEQLNREVAEQSANGGSLTLMVAAATAVVAVAADAMVRYGYSHKEVVPYLLDLAGVDL